MNRPTLEVADIIRAAGDSYWERHRSHGAWQHHKVLDAIARCRTPALGGHRDLCNRCGHQAISYNSCRNRHCPRCQGNARARWLAARSAELLPAARTMSATSRVGRLIASCASRLRWSQSKLGSRAYRGGWELHPYAAGRGGDRRWCD